MTLVLGASMALAWVCERQQARDAERANQLLAACGEQPWWVPGLWHLEVANALLVAERRGVIAPGDSDLFLSRLHALPIQTDGDAAPEGLSHVITLARADGLSTYDAAYPELAHRLEAVLASFDRRLNQAAGELGVALHT